MNPVQEVAVISLSEIRANEVSLRNVDTQSEGFLGMVDSIREKGVINAISVRRRNDSETGQAYFELVDGLHRYTASKAAGLESIPAQIVAFDDDQILEAQIIANIHKVDTKPAQYSKQLLRILNRNPLMTETELATKLGKSAAWIRNRLAINKIPNQKILDLIDQGEITLSNAFAMSKLPEDEQESYIAEAMTLPPNEFLPKIDSRVKELKEAARTGKDASAAVFQPHSFLRSMADLKQALESQEVIAELSRDVSTVTEGVIRGIHYAMHLDPASIEMQLAKEKARMDKKAELDKKKNEEKARKTAERAIKADAAAAEAAKSLGLDPAALREDVAAKQREAALAAAAAEIEQEDEAGA
jgi:ParB/RepB/Spo0J family partition protein